MGLYWICPYEYINLDSRNRWFICNPENMPSDFINSVDNFSTVPSGEEYLQINNRCRSILERVITVTRTFQSFLIMRGLFLKR